MSHVFWVYTLDLHRCEGWVNEKIQNGPLPLIYIIYMGRKNPTYKSLIWAISGHERKSSNTLFFQHKMYIPKKLKPASSRFSPLIPQFWGHLGPYVWSLTGPNEEVSHWLSKELFHPIYLLSLVIERRPCFHILSPAPASIRDGFFGLEKGSFQVWLEVQRTWN